MLLTCRSSNANCVVPVVIESTESDNESDEDCWVQILSQNTVNNISEMKQNSIKYFNYFHMRDFRGKS
jgi:hypothetical protein